MIRVSLLSIVIAGLSILSGCGSHAAKQAATPAAETTTYSGEAPPPPGGDMQFSFEGPAEKAAPRGNQAASFRPNAQERPKTGAVHAAN
jgi:hypothetical protein